MLLTNLPRTFSCLLGEMKPVLLLLLGVLSTVTAGNCGAAQLTELIEAQEGDKFTLQCCTANLTDLSNFTLTCKRTDDNFSDSNRFVYSRKHGMENPEPQMEQYRNRTHLVVENLSKGVLTVEISPVQRNDSGQYKCYIPALKILCYYNVTVNKRNWTEDVVMTTASVEVTTNPGTQKPPERIVANPFVIAAAAVAVVAVVVVVVIGVLWKRNKMGFCERFRGRRDEEDPSELEAMKTEAAESDENVSGAANGQRNLQRSDE